MESDTGVGMCETECAKELQRLFLMINAHFARLAGLANQPSAVLQRFFLFLFSQNARRQDTCARLETPSDILSSTLLSESNGVVQVCNEKQIFARGERRFKGQR